MRGVIPSHTSERAILSNLYNATGGAEWTNNDNWVSTEPTFKWFGVGIDTSGYVTALLLRNNQLSGEIPPELGNLPRLTVLYLRGNGLSGCIPAELHDVTSNDLDDFGLEFCSDDN